MKLSIAVIATGLALVGRATAIPPKVQNDDPNPSFKLGKCEPDGYCHLRDVWVHTGYRAEVKLWEQRSTLVRCGSRCSIDKLPVMEPPVNVGPPNPLAKGAPKKPTKGAPKKPTKGAPKKPAKPAPKKARRNLRTEARDRRH
ncbi:unnamed protein product [Clonostachys rhizophaga]|uniref:Uncharacterized protein n=1 Tax=Clonostachys rhizophaga TaxID=160324 RepID=A0A9N9YLG4_9HYPO|nr:unnamed protein product [Clonostachys rhizophaga]